MAISLAQAKEHLGIETTGPYEAYDPRTATGPKDEIETLVAAATALVTKYAPFAPEAVQDQAVLQIVGYVHDGPNWTERRAVTHNAMLSSGAAAMLTPWKVRRAGAIGAMEKS